MSMKLQSSGVEKHLIEACRERGVFVEAGDRFSGMWIEVGTQGMMLITIDNES